ncbi:MAG: hypothetical protein ABIG96_01110 [Candidatus Micrarchaeota archaeon]
MEKRKRAQTSFEYILIIGGAMLFTILVILIIRSGIISGQESKVTNDTETLSDCYLRPGVLFFDNFDSASAANWIPKAGTWAVQGNKYAQTAPTPASTRYISLTNKVFDNFTMTFRARSTNAVTTNKFFGVVFHSSSSANTNYMVFWWDSSGNTHNVYITKQKSATFTDRVFIDSAVVPGLLKNGNPEFKIRVYGDTVKVYEDDRLILSKDVGSSTFLLPVYYSGQIGFLTWGGIAGVTAEFDNICVYNE